MVRKRQAFEGTILTGFSVCQKSAGATVVHGRNAVQMRVAATALTDQSREVSLRSEWQVPPGQDAWSCDCLSVLQVTKFDPLCLHRVIQICVVPD